MPATASRGCRRVQLSLTRHDRRRPAGGDRRSQLASLRPCPSCRERAAATVRGRHMGDHLLRAENAEGVDAARRIRGGPENIPGEVSGPAVRMRDRGANLGARDRPAANALRRINRVARTALVVPQLPASAMFFLPPVGGIAGIVGPWPAANGVAGQQKIDLCQIKLHHALRRAASRLGMGRDSKNHSGQRCDHGGAEPNSRKTHGEHLSDGDRKRTLRIMASRRVADAAARSRVHTHDRVSSGREAYPNTVPSPCCASGPNLHRTRARGKPRP